MLFLLVYICKRKKETGRVRATKIIYQKKKKYMYSNMWLGKDLKKSRSLQIEMKTKAVQAYLF